MMTKPYRYTDKILMILSVLNIFFIFPQLWSLWIPLSLGILAHNIPFILGIILWGIGGSLLISLFTAFAFFKRWRILLVLYIPYCAYMLPKLLAILISYQDPRTYSAVYLPTQVFNWSLTILLILTLVAAVFFIIETYVAKRCYGYGNSVVFYK